MRYETAVAMLEEVPPHLPPMPRELVPVLLPGPDGRPARPDWPAQPEREAAVLLLLHPDEDGMARIVLTERTAGGHRHAGQISLPGGAIDEQDDSVVAAALREAREEVGLDAAAESVRVLGELPPVDVRVSGFRVHPVVAAVARQPALVADPREVAAILHAPLTAFLPGAPIQIVTDERDGLRLRYGAYPVGHHLVWGATAGILVNLSSLLRS
jgi:8-oxo-dGTP pyrophosphatase MutT (NUDIX family)